jgi:Ribophorin I
MGFIESIAEGVIFRSTATTVSIGTLQSGQGNHHPKGVTISYTPEKYTLILHQAHNWKSALEMSLSISFSSPLTFLLLYLYSCSVILASVPQSFHITNLLRTIDLTKPYIRDSTALILENISNSTQTEFFWSIPLELILKQSYLEVKEKKTGAATQLFTIELSNEVDSYEIRFHS